MKTLPGVGLSPQGQRLNSNDRAGLVRFVSTELTQRCPLFASKPKRLKEVTERIVKHWDSVDIEIEDKFDQQGLIPESYIEYQIRKWACEDLSTTLKEIDEDIKKEKLPAQLVILQDQKRNGQAVFDEIQSMPDNWRVHQMYAQREQERARQQQENQKREQVLRDELAQAQERLTALQQQRPVVVASSMPDSGKVGQLEAALAARQTQLDEAQTNFSTLTSTLQRMTDYLTDLYKVSDGGKKTELERLNVVLKNVIQHLAGLQAKAVITAKQQAENIASKALRMGLQFIQNARSDGRDAAYALIAGQLASDANDTVRPQIGDISHRISDLKTQQKVISDAKMKLAILAGNVGIDLTRVPHKEDQLSLEEMVNAIEVELRSPVAIQLQTSKAALATLYDILQHAVDPEGTITDRNELIRTFNAFLANTKTLESELAAAQEAAIQRDALAKIVTGMLLTIYPKASIHVETLLDPAVSVGLLDQFGQAMATAVSLFKENEELRQALEHRLVRLEEVAPIDAPIQKGPVSPPPPPAAVREEDIEGEETSLEILREQHTVLQKKLEQLREQTSTVREHGQDALAGHLALIAEIESQVEVLRSQMDQEEGIERAAAAGAATPPPQEPMVTTESLPELDQEGNIKFGKAKNLKVISTGSSPQVSIAGQDGQGFLGTPASVSAGEEIATINKVFNRKNQFTGFEITVASGAEVFVENNGKSFPLHGATNGTTKPLPGTTPRIRIGGGETYTLVE